MAAPKSEEHLINRGTDRGTVKNPTSQLSQNTLTLLVAGEGFEPPTSGL